MPKWRKDSVFGDGLRVRLDRNGRARFRFLFRAHKAAGRLTADGEDVAEVLLSALGDDGRLDLAHATIAERARCHVATVKRQLDRLRQLGLVEWTRRLVRGRDTGWRCEQTSNAYVLRPSACEAHPAPPVKKVRYLKAENQDATARKSAACQLQSLGFHVPEEWRLE